MDNEKTRSVEKTTGTTNKTHVLSSASGESCDKLEEEKRHSKEELVGYKLYIHVPANV